MDTKLEFYWPTYVICDSVEYYRSHTYPNFAEYVPAPGKMYKKCIVSRDQAIKWCNN